MPAGEPFRDYYAILGVAPTASLEEIRTAYRERAKRFHPDRAGPGVDPGRFRLLREAYEVLADSTERAAFDARLRARGRGGGERRGGSRRPSRGPAGTGRAGRRNRRALTILVLFPLGALLLGLWWSLARIDTLERQLRQATALSVTATPADLDDGEPGGRAPAAADVGGAILFRPGATELDARGEEQLAVLLAQFARVLRSLASGADWHLLISARAGRAVAGDGLPPDVRERTMARFESLAGRLLAAGIPPERIALRFVAGPYKAAVPVDGNRIELRLRCCGRRAGSQP